MSRHTSLFLSVSLSHSAKPPPLSPSFHSHSFVSKIGGFQDSVSFLLAIQTTGLWLLPW